MLLLGLTWRHCGSWVSASSRYAAFAPPAAWSAAPLLFRSPAERSHVAMKAKAEKAEKAEKAAKKRAPEGAAAPAPASASSVEVEAPPGGWPTVSVLVTGSQTRASRATALAQLAEQDYPMDKIVEVVVANVATLHADSPEELQPMLRGFVASSQSMSANIHKEVSACAGDVVAMWSDDQVSPAHRLRTQVAAAVADEAVTALRLNWHFDSASRQLREVQEWPQFDMAEAAEVSMPSNMTAALQQMVGTDPATLCGLRETFADALAKVEPQGFTEELQMALFTVAGGDTPLRLIDDLDWVVDRPVPYPAVGIEGTPDDQSLAEAAERTWPVKKEASMREISQFLEDLRKNEYFPSDAVNRLLLAGVSSAPTEMDVLLVKEGLDEALYKDTRAGKTALGVVATLGQWPGLELGKGTADTVRFFPVFFAVFQAVRKHISVYLDLYEMASLGGIAEGIVTLAQKMWAADGGMIDALVACINKEEETDPEAPRRGNMDPVGTLGLRDMLQDIAGAAADMPEDDDPFPVSGLSSLTKGLSEANINLPTLQFKVAQGVLRSIDKAQPPDIGKLFVAIHEKEWFKDEKTVAYLVQALVSRVRELKRTDEGIRQRLAGAVEEAEAEAKAEQRRARTLES